MILLDTSGLYAALDRDQRMHAAARRALEGARPPLVLSPFVLGELDYFLTREVGVEAETALLREVAAGAYDLAAFTDSDVAAALDVVERYRDAGVGLADASIVVLAGRHRSVDVLTLDERRFRALRAPSGRPFRILPADA